DRGDDPPVAAPRLSSRHRRLLSERQVAGRSDDLSERLSRCRSKVLESLGASGEFPVMFRVENRSVRDRNANSIRRVRSRLGYPRAARSRVAGSSVSQGAAVSRTPPAEPPSRALENRAPREALAGHVRLRWDVDEPAGRSPGSDRRRGERTAVREDPSPLWLRFFGSGGGDPAAPARGGTSIRLPSVLGAPGDFARSRAEHAGQ